MPHAVPKPFWASPLWRPLNDASAWSRIAQLFNRRWSLTECRASVRMVVRECPDVISLYLRPNRRFKGFRPGQHLAMTLPVDGVLQSRTFSLSQAPAKDGSLRLTIKCKPDGRVSRAAAALQPGDVVVLSQAGGEFALAEPEPGRGVLLLSAGSGITPIMAMLQDWDHRNAMPDAVLLHSCRSADDFIFNHELQTLVSRNPRLRVIPVFSAEHGRLDARGLQRLVPDYTERDALLCGPPAFMAWVSAFYAERGMAAQLRQEHFQPRITPIRADAESFSAFHADGSAAFTARSGQSLLEAAEAGGLKPAHGCRRGICMTCQCRKLAGVVHDQLTGLRSGDGEEWIRLCVSTPVSDLHMEFAAHG